MTFINPYSPAGRCFPPSTPCICSSGVTDARAPTLLASASDALVLAEARPPALLDCAPLALVLADTPPSAFLAFAPAALVLSEARTPALLACAFLALVLADAPAPPPLAAPVARCGDGDCLCEDVGVWLRIRSCAICSRRSDWDGDGADAGDNDEED
jgi:hypothetical protein